MAARVGVSVLFAVVTHGVEHAAFGIGALGQDLEDLVEPVWHVFAPTGPTHIEASVGDNTADLGGVLNRSNASLTGCKFGLGEAFPVDQRGNFGIGG